jgi:hypothetical protein
MPKRTIFSNEHTTHGLYRLGRERAPGFIQSPTAGLGHDCRQIAHLESGQPLPGLAFHSNSYSRPSRKMRDARYKREDTLTSLFVAGGIDNSRT